MCTPWRQEIALYTAHHVSRQHCVADAATMGQSNRTASNRGIVALMDSIRPFVSWQTNLQWVKDPPPEYAEKIQAPYDFWEEFERIYAKAKANGYPNEYQFGFELYRSFDRAHGMAHRLRGTS